MPRLVESLHARHRELCDIAASVSRAAREGDWRRYGGELAALRDGLLSLIAYERDDVLPQLERIVARELLAPLRDGHARLREEIDLLAAASPAHDPDGCRAELDTLAELLREHDRRSMSVFAGEAARDLNLAAPQEVAQASPPVDMRDLEPPEPLVRILDTIDKDPDHPLVVLLRHEPYPLYDLLRERGRHHRGRTRDDGGFELTIEARSKRP